LGHPFEHVKLDLDEIQSLDLHAVVEYKARQAFQILKKPVLVEDASLAFTAMGRLPGTFIKWFIEEIDYDGLLRLANSLPSQEAVGNICFALNDGETTHFFDGQMRGRIASEARGNGGFGFDSIFINEGYSQTRAEMNEKDYRATSYRAQAIEKLKIYLEA
jgi:non-canonical purine NTP pyrophosphatase (RdgB/HAM1 family)